LFFFYKKKPGSKEAKRGVEVREGLVNKKNETNLKKKETTQLILLRK
jgi:hypothetical protein